MSASTPTPSDIARRLAAARSSDADLECSAAKADSSKRRREQARARACTDKVRYDTEALALDALHVAYMTYAEQPMGIYACRFCSGYHLTSHLRPGDSGDGGDATSSGAAVPIEINPEDYAGHLLHRKDLALAKYARKRYRRLAAKAKRAQAAEDMLSCLPVPQVASEEEAAEFFAKYAKGDADLPGAATG